MKKFNTPFETLINYRYQPEIALRKAIIIQAVTDAVSVGVDRKSQKRKKEARDWIFTNSDYFRNICMEGDMCPDQVIKLLQTFMVGAEDMRAPAMQSKKATNVCTQLSNSIQKEPLINKISNVAIKSPSKKRGAVLVNRVKKFKIG